MLTIRKVNNTRAAHLKRIARRGALARISKYGNPGTPEGRRRGGINSQITHKKNGTGFNTLKRVSFPHQSISLAELLGIFMGDGHVGLYQATITTNSVTDLHHAQFASSLISRLFKISAPVRKRKGMNACEVVISSKEACRFLVSQGMPCGSKIRDGVVIPRWIRKNESYKKAFLRGLFDTDGCFYVDIHRIKGKVYKNAGMAFSNRSLPLLKFFKKTLEVLGFHPTQRTPYEVFLRRSADIEGYFKLIGTSNQKHLSRWKGFVDSLGG